MKKTTCLILSILIFVTSLLAQGSYNPCEDKMYLELKNKKISEMTDREYSYFLRKDIACAEYIKYKDLKNINFTIFFITRINYLIF